IEDIGIMTSIPNIAVFEVCDACQARRLLDYSLEFNGPMYIRSTVEPTEDIYDDNIKVCSGGSVLITEGDDGAILCSGVTVQYAIEASKIIKEESGQNIRVVDMYSIKPIDRNAVIEASKTGRIVVVQDHNTFGGLGSAVCKVLAEESAAVKLKIMGIPDGFVAMAHAPYLYEKFGLNAKGIKQSVLELG
ncbi:MAG: transketolase family protein, partial [Eubacterium sp.]|nr:transketolase family protein [Eubacterium sp.]